MRFDLGTLAPGYNAPHVNAARRLVATTGCAWPGNARFSYVQTQPDASVPKSKRKASDYSMELGLFARSKAAIDGAYYLDSVHHRFEALLQFTVPDAPLRFQQLIDALERKPAFRQREIASFFRTGLAPTASEILALSARSYMPDGQASDETAFWKRSLAADARVTLRAKCVFDEAWRPPQRQPPNSSARLQVPKLDTSPVEAKKSSISCRLSLGPLMAGFGLKWRKLGPNEPCKGTKLTGRHCAQWQRLQDGAEKKRLAALAAALQHNCKGDTVEFTRAEWRAFGINAPRKDHYIKSDKTYFQPVAEIAVRVALKLPSVEEQTRVAQRAKCVFDQTWRPPQGAAGPSGSQPDEAPTVASKKRKLEEASAAIAAQPRRGATNAVPASGKAKAAAPSKPTATMMAFLTPRSGC